MKKIENVEQWALLSKALREKGYRLWQMQYFADLPEGFHAWFSHSEKSDIEVVTHSKNVQEEIVSFNSNQ